MDERARRLIEAYDAVSPLIESFTAEVCPTCERVCCIDRHAVHEPEDIAFLDAIGEYPAERPAKAADTEPCRHLGPRGCQVERRLRPYRCTWYFCEPLLTRLNEVRGRRARALTEGLVALSEARQGFLSRRAG